VLAAGERGVIDLLGVTRQGRLVVIELKASEDLHLPLHAVDYWLRVRRHLVEGGFSESRLFPLRVTLCLICK
jgi:RecB family endonuclease NucS